MPNYDLTISVIGKDKASGVFKGLADSFREIGRVALGVLARDLVRGAGRALGIFAGGVITATGQIQIMRLSIESLVAKELVDLNDGFLTIAAALPVATEKAGDLMDQLADLAILSPFTLEAVQNTFRLGMAFGFTADQSMLMSQGILNIGAGVGANNERLQRMAYNLSQINLQGKVTSLDVRQLALAGLDLNKVLRFVGDQMGVNIVTHEDFNKAIADGTITWQDFATNFALYSETYFAGASERMSRSLLGLQSTFHDVFVLTMPQLFGPLIEEITLLLGSILDIALAFRSLGGMAEWGEKLGASAHVALEGWTTFFTNIAVTMSRGITPFESFRSGIMKTFGRDALAEFDGFLVKIDDIKLRVANMVLGVKGKFAVLSEPFENIKLGFTNLWTVVVGLAPSIRQGLLDIFLALGGLSDGSAGDDLLGFSETFAEVTGNMVENLPIMIEAIDSFASKVADEWIPAIGPFFEDMANVQIPAFLEAVDAFGERVGTLIEIGSAITIIALAAKAGGALAELGKLFGFIAELAPTIGELFLFMGEALSPLLGPILLIAAAIGVVVATVLENKDAVITWFSNMADIVSTVLGPTIAEFKTSWDGLVAGFASFWEATAPIRLFILQVLGVAVQVILPIVIGLFNFLISTVGTIMSTIGTLLSSLGTMITGAVTMLTGVWNIIVGIFTGNWELVNQGGRDFIGGFLLILQGLWTSMVAIFTNIGTSVTGIITNFFVPLVDTVVGYIDGWVPRLQDAGMNAIAGLLKGLSDAWKGIKAWISDAATELANLFADMLGIDSPSKVFAGFGKNIIEGLTIGLETTAPMVAPVMTNIVDDLTGAAASASNATNASSTDNSSNVRQGDVFDITIEGNADVSLVDQIIEAIQALQDEHVEAPA